MSSATSNPLMPWDRASMPQEPPVAADQSVNGSLVDAETLIKRNWRRAVGGDPRVGELALSAITRGRARLFEVLSQSTGHERAALDAGAGAGRELVDESVARLGGCGAGAVPALTKRGARLAGDRVHAEAGSGTQLQGGS